MGRENLLFERDFKEDFNFKMNSQQQRIFDKISALADAADTFLFSMHYYNKKEPFWFPCAKCGSPHFNRWMHLQRGFNLDFLCPACMWNASPTINYIRKVFAERGAILVSTVYVNWHTPLLFLCSKCGRPHSICWTNFQQGYNPDLVCPLCKKNVSPTIDFLKAYFVERGAILLTTEYCNNTQKLEFICRCGRKHWTTWTNLQQGRNPHLLCARCLKLRGINPGGLDYYCRNTELGGTHWFNCGRMFFNVLEGYQDISAHGQFYSFHHLFSYEKYPLLRSSITNGFPVPYKTVHDPACGLYSQIIHSEKWHNPESWNTDEFQTLYFELYRLLKLPYHIYSNFKFWDLTKFLITETVLDNTDLDMIHQHEQFWKNKGRIYIPVSWKEYAYKPDRDRFFSQIRDELRQFIPEIDQYTGVGYKL